MFVLLFTIVTSVASCGMTWPWLQEGAGGKLHVFMSSLPKLGLHALTPRPANPATDNQQKQMSLLPAHKGFQHMAEDAAEHQVWSPLSI